MQAEENAGPGGTCENEGSEDVTLEVRTDLVCANYSFFSLSLCECCKVQFKLPANLTFAV